MSGLPCRTVAGALACALAACGTSDERAIVLVRVETAEPGCGAPADARTLFVRALGDAPGGQSSTNLEIPGEPIAITTFPADTRQLEVQVLGAAGVERTIGKTAPFELSALEDGAEVPVMMAPRLGACRVGSLAVARDRPLAAPVAGGVLIAGGADETGTPVPGAERYDPAAGGFVAAAGTTYGASDTGLLGASLTALADGRAVLIGGGATAYQIYDDGLGAPLFFPEARAHHAAVALGGARVLLAGGCAALTAAGACAPGSVLADSSILDVDAGTLTPGPALLGARVGGAAFREADGRIVLLGGVDESGTPQGGERLDVDLGTSEAITGAWATGAPLMAGGVLSAFGPDGVAGDAAAVVAPGAAGASSVGMSRVARAGATLTALEDGTVLAVGGAAAGDASMELYQPHTEALVAAEDASLPMRSGHAAVRLLDGTVLIAGGRDPAGLAVADAWIVRPDLTGPLSRDAAVSFQDPALARLAVPRDPAAGRTEDGSYVLRSSGTGGALPSEWLVVAGPRFGDLQLDAVVSGAGVAALLGFVDAANYDAVVALPGQPGTLLQVRDGAAALTGSCAGQILPAGALDGPATLSVSRDDTGVEATVAGAPVLSCTGVEPTRGAVGIGVVGAEGAELIIDSILVAR